MEILYTDKYLKILLEYNASVNILKLTTSHFNVLYSFLIH